MRKDIRKRVNVVIEKISDGYCLWSEIREQMGVRGGSALRLRETLEREELVQVIRGKFGRFPYDILILTEAGREYAKQLGLEVKQTDWERLEREHNARNSPAHALAVLIFAWQARRRGWQADVLPRFSRAYAKPDVRVEQKGERVYVEVEVLRNPRRHSDGYNPWLVKWNNQMDYQGYVAVCTLTPIRRAGIVSVLQEYGFSGLATDLMTLLKQPDSDLWLERWNWPNEFSMRGYR
ncbi:hypothetical protein QYE77_14375 [Thermanaerothrix sp. 4228-RoL]|uniref:Uncharacterized protein n=1 Tax=Thermanaerothrix solaris TaxID=3058434 RepID=A0ABU3NTI7_9CHLR|nr:hypothetical protein [Thermanaerothrix sp. 4228-RoL]MDT8899447.1 hypothetical protein [Thermanaerothrix sp. 4228-RoL]